MHEKLYQEETQRAERLKSRLNIPQTVFVAIIGLLAFLLQNIPREPNYQVYFLWTTLGLVVVSLFIAFIYFCRVWYGEENKIFPTAMEIDEYYLQLRTNYFPYPNAKKLTEQAFQNYLLDSYKEYATTNARNNDRISKHLSRVTLSLTFAISMSMAAVLYRVIFDDAKYISQQKESIECPINANHRHHLKVQVQDMSEMMYQSQAQLAHQNSLPQNGNK